jgi:hypothetical protein
MADQQTQGGADADAEDQSSNTQVDGSPDASSGYCIEIKVDSQGNMKVGVEPSSDEEGEDDNDDDFQEVDNLQQAFKLIKEIVSHAGNMADMTQSSDEMDQGYGSGPK